MESKIIARVHLVSRISLAFVFMYHGLVPKLLSISAIEVTLTDAHHLGYPAVLISSIAGIAEVLLGLSVLIFTKTLIPVYIANILLLVLLVDVAIVMPQLLIEAFNPVTLNLVSLAMGYIIIITQKRSKV